MTMLSMLSMLTVLTVMTVQSGVTGDAGRLLRDVVDAQHGFGHRVVHRVYIHT